MNNFQNIKKTYPVLNQLDPQKEVELVEKFVHCKYLKYNIQTKYSQEYKHKSQREHFEMDIRTITGLLEYLKNTFVVHINENGNIYKNHWADINLLKNVFLKDLK